MLDRSVGQELRVSALNFMMIAGATRLLDAHRNPEADHSHPITRAPGPDLQPCETAQP
jgi:hypothetical protein